MSGQGPASVSEAKRRLLEKMLSGKGGTGEASARSGIPRRSSGAVAPQSFQQEQVWTHAQLQADRPAYNEVVTLHRRGPLDARVLERCFEEIVRRHESWRTTFGQRDGVPVQIVHGQGAPVSLPVHDLRALPDSEREQSSRQLATENAERVFDLEQLPLWRGCLVRLGDDHHQLHLSIHQLIMDGVTVFQNLLKEIPPLYDAFLRGERSPLPEPALQYADFAAWQRSRLTDEFLEPGLRYWRRKLAAPLPVLTWPDEFPRPPVQTFRGATENRLIPSDLIDPLKELAAHESASLFMALTSGFVALLHRYTGQEDILLGTPAGNRESGTENLFGYFINMLPLRFDVTGDPSFRELLGRVRSVVAEALAHGRVPFLRILRELNLPRDPSRNPLFQLMITLEPLPHTGDSGWNLTQAEVSCGAAKVDLDLSLETRADGVMAPMLYNPDLFSAGALHRMFDHWTTLLRSAVANPDRKLSELRLLTDEEHHTYIIGWNATASPYPAGCLPHLFEACVRRTPEATAVVFDGVPTTYRELNRRANRLAHRLIAAGAGPETRVGLCLSRSPDLLAGLLGVLKSGAAYVPLDPQMPEVRWKMILEDARCPIVVTEAGHENRFATAGVRMLRCLPEDGGAEDVPETDPPARASENDLAYVLFTSGSTGRPKGVEIEHRSLVNLLGAMAAEIDFKATDILLAVTTISFDIAGLELFLPLVCGGSVLLAGADDVSDGERLIELMDRGEATVMQATPSTWRLLVESGWKGRRSLRVLVGGEAFPTDLVAALHLRTRDVWNVYGPTETTIWSTLHRVVGTEERSVPIGRPLANTRCYVLDARQKPVPPGRAGELYLGGDGLARGYAGRPDLTADRFLNLDPGDGSRQRLYRTGDLVRLGPSGELEYLGRLDQQVKVRGYRIELGDVEAALLQIPSISAAVALVRESGGEAELAAFVIPASGPAPAESELLNALRAVLPGYMIPSRIAVVSAFPLTPNGKVDRLGLAKSSVPEAAPPLADGMPSDPLEGELAGVWGEILGRPPVGIHDNFFSLGGHSLQALRMVTRLRNQLAVPVALADLFVHPTVSGLAGRIRNLLGSAGASPIPRLPEGGGSRIPATSEQTGLWISHQLAANPVSHNVVTATRLRGILDLSRLERAWRRVIRRQDVLRTRLRLDAGDVIQEVVDYSGPVLEVEEISAGAAGDVEAAVAAAARVTLDPAVCPAWRLRVLRIGPEDHGVVFAAHHILLDEWSLHSLVAELATAYRLDSDGREGLPDLPIRFADFAVWHEERLRSAEMEDHAGYWRQVLDGVGQRLALPSDRPEPERPTGRGGLLSFNIPAETRSALEALARSQGTSVFVAGLACWQAWLASSTGDRDVVVGTPLAERDRPEVEHLAGLFLQTLPMRILVDPAEDFRTMLGRVHRRVTEGFRHAAYPLARMVGASFRRLGARSLFPSLFVLVDRPWPEIRIPGTQAEMMPAHHGAARFDLILSLTPGPAGGWTAELEFSEDRFSPEHARRLSESVASYFARVGANPDLPALASEFRVGLPAGAAGARRRRLAVTEELGPPPPNLMALLEAGLTPHLALPALRDDSRTLTYGEMLAGYERLASVLKSRNVGPGTVVALCLDRSVDLVLGVLGILKAGAAYVPVDPSYPAERIAAMLEDSRPAAVVTDRRHADLFGTSIPNRVLLEDLATFGSLPPASECPAGPGDLAYVLFTSGSTGRPKGVAMPHRALVNLILWQRRTSILTPGQRTLQFAPISFDVSFQEIFSTLVQRGTLVMIPNEERLDPARLLERVRTQEIHRLIVPFVALQFLAEAVLRARNAPVSLEEIFTSGEALRITPAIAAMFGRLPVCRFCNQYGPTETHVVTEFELSGPPASWEATPPIGSPIDGVVARVLDEQLHPVPEGREGELCLGGICLAEGYLHRPELTAARFVSDPTEPSRRLYRTGDRAVLRSDGLLEYRGRMDGQVKVRGHRVEVGEVESVLMEHPGIHQAVVLTRPDGGGSVELVACFQATPGAGLSAVDLRRHLSLRLPEYMLPAHYRELDQMPLTASGKVDRSVPLETLGRELESGAPGEPPRNSLEETLCREWAAILGCASVGIRDSFFLLGGQSLLALRLVDRLQTVLGRPVRLADLFANPTVAGFAGQLQETRSGAAAPSPLFHGRETGVPWFHVPGILGVEFLTPALEAVIGRHRPYYDRLQYPGIDHETEPLRDAESIAAALVRQVEAIYPAGPLWLSGFSFGGLVAQEMARQMALRGRRVDRIVLFDSCPRPSLRRRPVFEQFQVLSGRIRALPLRERPGFLSLIVRKKVRDAVAGFRKRFRPAVLPEERVKEASFEAYSRFLPQAYPGAVTLLRATKAAPVDTSRWAKDEINGWWSLDPAQLEIINLPCDHERVFLDPVAPEVLQAVESLLRVR